MSLLKKLEQKLEALVEGFFANQFKSGVQPIELAKKLIREMEAHKTISISKVYVPNEYILFLSEGDFENFKSFESALTRELQDFLVAEARKQGCVLPGPARIKLESRKDLALGEIDLASTLKADEQMPIIEELSDRKTRIFTADVAPKAERPSSEIKSPPAGQLILLQEGERRQIFPLTKKVTTVGRMPDNDLVLNKTSISRHHAEIERRGDHYYIRDLDSTNGTLVNDRRVKRKKLQDGDRVTIATQRFLFKEKGA